MSDKKWLKIRFRPFRTPLGDVRVVMRVEESNMGYGKAYTVGVFKGTLVDVACAVSLAYDDVCWTSIPPLMTDEIPLYWRSIAIKMRAQIIELCSEAKHYSYG